MADAEVLIEVEANDLELLVSLLETEGVEVSPKLYTRLQESVPAPPQIIYVLALSVAGNLTTDALKLAVGRAIEAPRARTPSTRARICDDQALAEHLRTDPESWGSE